MKMYDYEKAVQYCKKLELFKGYVPCLLRPAPFNLQRYYENLKKEGLFEEVIEKTEQTRKFDFDEKISELEEFVKKYPEYSDVLVE